MGKKLLKTFTNNIGFKILAIAFAFILWLVVYNLNDPVKTKTFTTTANNKKSMINLPLIDHFLKSKRRKVYQSEIRIFFRLPSPHVDNRLIGIIQIDHQEKITRIPVIG